MASVLEALGRARRPSAGGRPPAPSHIGPAPQRIHPRRSSTVATGASAVLVLLFEEDGECRVVLTRRSTTLRTHTGQVSFPGGRIDPGEDPVAAALREAHEEVGVDPAAVQPVGLLAPGVTFSTGARITPVVATFDRRPVLQPNPAEVDRGFDVALALLASSFREELWSEPGLSPFAMYFFEVSGETVWGATARILVDLLTIVLAT